MNTTGTSNTSILNIPGNAITSMNFSTSAPLTTEPFITNLGRPKPSYFYTIRIAIWLTTSFISICGNSLVVIISVINRRGIGVCRTFIAHLALCDLLYGVLQICAVISRIEKSDEWLGVAGCKTVETFLFMMTILSCWTIVVIAIERHRGIVQPMQPQWGSKQLRITMVAMWLCSLVSVAPLFLSSNYSADKKKCYEEWSQDDAVGYAWFLFIINVALPMFILVILYTRIIVKMKKPSELEILQQNNENTNQAFLHRRQKEERRIIKLLMLMVVLYFILITPDNLVRIIVLQGGIKSLSVTAEHFFFFFAMAFSVHICVNPFLYSMVDKKFRNNLFALCRCQKTGNFGRMKTTSSSNIVSSGINASGKTKSRLTSSSEL